MYESEYVPMTKKQDKNEVKEHQQIQEDINED